MPCNTLLDDKGQPAGFICTAPWGMGVTDYGQFEDFPDEEFRYVYGFGGSGDPHCFEPSFEENTPEEIAAWKTAIEACQCGRPEPFIPEEYAATATKTTTTQEQP